MPELSNRLSKLGLKLGAAHIKKETPRRPDSLIEQIIPGEIWNTVNGEAYVVEQTYPSSHCQGTIPLLWEQSLGMLAAWAGAPEIAQTPPEQFTFLDTETSGLGGGTGTYTFMIGAGRFENGQFRLAQFFLRDPAEETAQLAALEQFLAPTTVLVTFNGKSFDVPMLNTRYAMHGWPSPVASLTQLDLLHLARRLWRMRLPSRRLGDLEQQILGSQRTHEDVPGFMVPEIYYDYIHRGNVEPLKGVFYHNAMDILSLSSLLNYIAGLLNQPTETTEQELDLFAIGILKENLGMVSDAVALYRHCLGLPLDKTIYIQVLSRLAAIHKRANEYEDAARLWKVAAKLGDIQAHVELAKWAEHYARDLPTALEWTEAALAHIGSPGVPQLERVQWRKDLDHRLNRLKKKLSLKQDWLS